MRNNTVQTASKATESQRIANPNRVLLIAAGALLALSACSTSESITSDATVATTTDADSPGEPVATDSVTTDSPASTEATAPTNPPATAPPATTPPATNPPLTNPPTTNPPVTDPPVTDPPTTDPQPQAPTFNSFSVSAPECDAADGEAPIQQALVTIRWDIVDATSVYVAIDNEFGPYEQDLPLVGELTVNHNCIDDTNTYFVVAENSIGRTVEQVTY